MSSSLSVAPHAGARIETLIVYDEAQFFLSLPTRERELKHRQGEIGGHHVESLPTRERELKHQRLLRRLRAALSLPTRERELKPARHKLNLCRILSGGVLKCMLINGGQTKSNGDTVYLSCASSNYRLLSSLPWTEYKAKRQIRQ